MLHVTLTRSFKFNCCMNQDSKKQGFAKSRADAILFV